MPRTFDVRNDEVRDLVLAECTRVIREDGLLVVPTDTVYGIAADAFSQKGVNALLAAKGRGRDFPPPVLVARPEVVPALAEVRDQTVFSLLAKFWPGPLTVILPAQPSLDWDLGETHGTVALRMPDEKHVLELLAKTGPLAVSSANTHGVPAATTAAEAEAMLGDSVEIYLDAGQVPGVGSSTIVDMSAVPPRIVRRGPISHAELAEIVPDLLDFGAPAAAGSSTAAEPATSEAAPADPDGTAAEARDKAD